MAKRRKDKNRAKRANKAAQPSPATDGAAKLIFPPSPGTVEGFTASSQSSFSAEPSSCVRELVQNALDAALVSAGRNTAVARFVVERRKLAEIPGMPEYKAALASAMRGDLNDLTRGIADSLHKHSEKEDASVLFVMDNGVGFDAPRLGAMLGDGVSQQSGEESRGAFGNGHLTAFALSRLRYAFYGGVSAAGEMMFSGHAVLATHAGKYGGKPYALGKDGYYVRRINEDKLNFARFDFPRKADIPPLLLPKMEWIKNEWGSGSVVAVAAFNDFGGERDVEEVILREAALNFYVAVDREKLRVEITRGGKTRVLNRGDLRAILEKRKENMRGKDGFPSGRRVWNSYCTLTDGSPHTVATSRGEIKLMIRQGGDGKRVALCRNGMWITGEAPRLWQADFGDRKPFDALLLVDAETSGEAHTLFKLAETPLHNKIKVMRLPSAEDRQKLRALLDELREKIKGLTEEKSDESFSPADIMPIEFAAESARGEKPKARGQIEKIGGRQAGGDEKSKSKKQTGSRKANRSGSALSAKISSRRIREGTLAAVFAPAEDCEDVEMRLSLDGGEDITCAGREHRTVVFSAVRVNGGEVPGEKYVKNEKGEIVGARLGEWKSGKHYGMEADYRPPAGEKIYALVVDLYRRKAPQSAAKTENENAGN